MDHSMNFWYHQDKVLLKYLLMPLSLLFRFIIFIRKNLYRLGVFKTKRFPVPIIIIGNLTVGGTGKTPLIIELAWYFTGLNYQVGIVSRGYGGRQRSPHLVRAGDDPRQMGDEAVLMARRTNCPVVVARDRAAAVECLLKTLTPTNPSPTSGGGEQEGNSVFFPSSVCGKGARSEGSFIVLSDDGLQHYGLRRDIEIVVVDGERRFGNEACLPAGPLREPLPRLKSIDFIIVNGNAKQSDEYSFKIKPGILQSVVGEKTLAIADCQGKVVYAIAGIGHPQRFFDTLNQLGLVFKTRVFPDHYQFNKSDIDIKNADMIVMTEKDAVKCRRFADDRHFYLPITIECDLRFLTDLTTKLRSLI